MVLKSEMCFSFAYTSTRGKLSLLSKLKREKCAFKDSILTGAEEHHRYFHSREQIINRNVRFGLISFLGNIFIVS